MQLNEVNLLDLQTQYMQKDQTTIALCKALNPELLKIIDSISLINIWNNIDSLPEEILDELANDLNISWYDAMADIKVKRELIKNSDKVHMRLGTKWAVEKVIQDYFGDGEVLEWFEYGGAPFMFKIRTTNQSITSDQEQRFLNVLDKVKNVRSTLEKIEVASLVSETSYISGLVHVGDYYTLETE